MKDVPTDSVAAVVTRGTGEEAWHRASVVVLGEDARPIAWFGDPERVTFARSSIKPFQASAVVAHGAADAMRMTDEELAVACASHSGSDGHVRVVEGLLAKAGAGSADLGCGAHLPIDYRIHGRTASAGEDRDPLRNACSGKHAAFLALTRHVGDPIGSYLDPHGTTQRLVRAALCEACGVTESELPVGIDGCSAPNYALPLSALARGMLRLMRAEASAGGLDAALARLRAAMWAHPLLVSGEQRFDYDLMRAFPGNVVCKVGAEGLELIGLREPTLAIAIKVEDGADRALGAICVAVLEQLGVVRAGELPPPLVRHRRPRVKNHRKLVTGEVVATLALSFAPGSESTVTPSKEP